MFVALVADNEHSPAQQHAENDVSTATKNPIRTGLVFCQGQHRRHFLGKRSDRVHSTPCGVRPLPAPDRGSRVREQRDAGTRPNGMARRHRADPGGHRGGRLPERGPETRHPLQQRSPLPPSERRRDRVTPWGLRGEQSTEEWPVRR